MSLSPRRPGHVRTSSRFKRGCIIAAGVWGGHRALFKNRDRNYVAQVSIVHEIRGGVEVAYICDEITGWCEGLNERGIGLVNAALAVSDDENAAKKVDLGKGQSKDGPRILKALEQTSVDDAVRVARTYEGGIKGHTFISSAEKTVSLEQTSLHQVKTERVDPDEDEHIRTNHGLFYADAGYTEGDNYVSSVVRRERATAVVRDAKSPGEVPLAVMAARADDRSDPNNMVRDTDNMSTTSQMVLDLTGRVLHFYVIPGKCKFLGFERDLPEGYEPKIKVRLYRYEDEGTQVVELDPETEKRKSSPKPVKKARRAPSPRVVAAAFLGSLRRR